MTFTKVIMNESRLIYENRRKKYIEKRRRKLRYVPENPKIYQPIINPPKKMIDSQWELARLLELSYRYHRDPETGPHNCYIGSLPREILKIIFNYIVYFPLERKKKTCDNKINYQSKLSIDEKQKTLLLLSQFDDDDDDNYDSN